METLEPTGVFQTGHDDLLSLFTRHHEPDRNFRIKGKLAVVI